MLLLWWITVKWTEVNKTANFLQLFYNKSLPANEKKKSTFSASTEQWFKQFSCEIWCYCPLHPWKPDRLWAFIWGRLMYWHLFSLFSPKHSFDFSLFPLLKVIMCQVKLLLNPSLRPYMFCPLSSVHTHLNANGKSTIAIMFASHTCSHSLSYACTTFLSTNKALKSKK